MAHDRSDGAGLSKTLSAPLRPPRRAACQHTCYGQARSRLSGDALRSPRGPARGADRRRVRRMSESARARSYWATSSAARSARPTRSCRPCESPDVCERVVALRAAVQAPGVPRAVERGGRAGDLRKPTAAGPYRRDAEVHRISPIPKPRWPDPDCKSLASPGCLHSAPEQGPRVCAGAPRVRDNGSLNLTGPSESQRPIGPAIPLAQRADRAKCRLARDHPVVGRVQRVLPRQPAQKRSRRRTLSVIVS